MKQELYHFIQELKDEINRLSDEDHRERLEKLLVLAKDIAKEEK